MIVLSRSKNGSLIGVDIADAGTMYARYGGMFYIKQNGQWLIHGSQFGKNDNALYSVNDSDLFLELEAVKSFKRVFDDLDDYNPYSLSVIV